MTMSQHNHTDESCRKLFAKLSEYLDGELSDTQRDEIERHVKDCLKCHNCIETLRRTIDLCRHMKSEPVPDDFAKALADIVGRMET